MSFVLVRNVKGLNNFMMRSEALNFCRGKKNEAISAPAFAHSSDFYKQNLWPHNAE